MFRSDTDSSRTTGACRTPDSTLSTGSGLSAFSHMTGSNPYYRLPEKLKIVKPIEGNTKIWVLMLTCFQKLGPQFLGHCFVLFQYMSVYSSYIYNYTLIPNDDICHKFHYKLACTSQVLRIEKD